MSTMPVTRLSTMQNSLSIPIVTNMTKKVAAHKGPAGNCRTTAG